MLLTFVFRSHQKPNFSHSFSYSHINNLGRGKSPSYNDHISLSPLLNLASHIGTRESLDFHAMAASTSTFRFI